jgi:hypothetical protein
VTTDVKPTFTGPGGSAWEVAVPDAPGHGQVCQWLLFAPTAHPFWNFHVITVAHLLPIEGVKDAHVQFPGASHEMLVLALDPETEDAIDPADAATQKQWMQPPDAVVQFIVANDEQACAVARFSAQAVTQGLIAPDSDFRQAWEVGVAATAEHVRLGEHPEG